MFTGYSDKTVDFFWDIRFNNSREWFHPRKDQFNAYIMDPTKALSGELYDWLTENYPQATIIIRLKLSIVCLLRIRSPKSILPSLTRGVIARRSASGCSMISLSMKCG